MHIAIDDTYGPEMDTESKYVTGNRRTHVAVLFADSDVNNIRTQINECKAQICESTGVEIEEFHFTDIYNRRGPWKKVPSTVNLGVFEVFANIYSHYQWPVFIQTIDDRTLRDFGRKKFGGTLAGLDLSKDEDLSLLFLLFRIKSSFTQNPKAIDLFLDEGRKGPGKPFAEKIFNHWKIPYHGRYASSAEEPLLQLADFIAFCVNRNTHLAIKSKRTDIDNWFLGLVAGMKIKCDELKRAALPKDFTPQDFDKVHEYDRKQKGL